MAQVYVVTLHRNWQMGQRMEDVVGVTTTLTGATAMAHGWMQSVLGMDHERLRWTGMEPSWSATTADAGWLFAVDRTDMWESAE